MWRTRLLCHIILMLLWELCNISWVSSAPYPNIITNNSPAITNTLVNFCMVYGFVAVTVRNLVLRLFLLRGMLFAGLNSNLRCVLFSCFGQECWFQRSPVPLRSKDFCIISQSPSNILSINESQLHWILGFCHGPAAHADTTPEDLETGKLICKTQETGKSRKKTTWEKIISCIQGTAS
jgi:hypothetical protein